jgi:glycine cleavage system H lipoate-binding protein
MKNKSLSSHFDQKHLQDGTVVITFSMEAKEEFKTAQWIDFPKVGAMIRSLDLFVSIESTKAIFELESPVSGKVIEVHKSSTNLLDSFIRMEPV